VAGGDEARNNGLAHIAEAEKTDFQRTPLPKQKMTEEI
jgi:hypothetical protein